MLIIQDVTLDVKRSEATLLLFEHAYFQHDLRQGLLLGYNNPIEYERLPFPSMWKQKVQLGAWPKGSFWVVSVESSTRHPKFEVEWSFYGLICLSKDVIITNGQSLDVSGTA